MICNNRLCSKHHALVNTFKNFGPHNKENEHNRCRPISESDSLVQKKMIFALFRKVTSNQIHSVVIIIRPISPTVCAHTSRKKKPRSILSVYSRVMKTTKDKRTANKTNPTLTMARLSTGRARTQQQEANDPVWHQASRFIVQLVTVIG